MLLTIVVSKALVNRQNVENVAYQDKRAKLTAIEVQQTKEDPRITRTRKLLRDALSSLLSEKSFESISVQDIAERATVNRATFYAHYADKPDLLEAIIREAFRESLSEGDPFSASDTDAALHTVSLNVFRFVEGHGHCKLDKQFEPQFERTMQSELYAFLANELTDAAALVVSSAIIGAAMQWRASRRKEPAEHLVRQIVDVLSCGVAKAAR